jgi:hypothetical protein
LLALPLIVIVALAGPGKVGAKPTVTEHRPFGPTWPLQLVEAENSTDPETLPRLKVTAAPLFFFAVLVSIKPFTLLLPTLTLSKFKELLETRTIAGTLCVGVGLGVGVGAGVGVAVGVSVGVGVNVGVGVGFAVAVGVGVGVVVAVGVGDGLGLEPL